MTEINGWIVEKLTPKQVAELTTVIKWPFCKMAVGESVTIEDKSGWKSAQRAAHATAGNSCWEKKFSSAWQKKANIGIIWRVK